MHTISASSAIWNWEPTVGSATAVFPFIGLNLADIRFSFEWTANWQVWF